MSDLPPLDQPQAYVVVGPNDQRGPYTLELLIDEVVAGRLYDATPVWWPGLDQWTTMGTHHGVVSEIARRRAGGAPSATDPVYQAPAAEPQAGQYAAGQYSAGEQQSDPYAQQQAAQATYSPQAQQDQASPVEQPVGQATAPAPIDTTATGADPSYQSPSFQSIDATVVAGAQAQDLPTTGPAVDADDVTVPAASPTVTPLDTTTSVAARSVSDEERERFGRLVDRSRDRSRAAERIGEVDDSFITAVAAGASTRGFTLTDQTSGDTTHELRFDGGPGETLGLSVGRIRGDDPAEVRSGHVPFTVRFQSATYGGTLDAGSGAHGELVIVSDEWSGQATSMVSLLLALEDYLAADLVVDSATVASDVAATVAVVSGAMR